MGHDRYTESRPCPCGKGTYTKVTLEDDWMRSTVSYTMECPVCLPVYRLFHFRDWAAEARRKHDGWRRWVTAEQFGRHAALTQALKAAAAELVRARAILVPLVVNLLEQERNRPAKHRRLLDVLGGDGLSGSYYDFNRTVRDDGLAAAVARYVTPYTYDRIETLTGSEDAELNALVAANERAEEALEEFERVLFREGVKVA